MAVLLTGEHAGMTRLPLLLVIVAAICVFVAACKDFGWLDQDPVHAFGWLAIGLFFALIAWLVGLLPAARVRQPT